MLAKLLRKKRFVIIAAFVVLVGGYYAYAKARGSSNQVQYVTATVQKGMITASVSASGNMTVGSSANVNAAVSGTVESVAVKPGDSVKQGQVLFTVKNDQLDTNVSKSYASLLQAQGSLASAEAQETQDQSNYDNASGQAGSPASANITALQAAVNSAQVSLSVAQAQFGTDQAAGCKTTTSSGSSGGPGGSSGSSTQDPCPKDQEAIASAQAQLDQANASLAKAQQSNQAADEGLSAYSASLQAAQSSVTAAEQNVTAAQQDYQDQQNTANERTVTSPIDGTITTVNIKTGDTVGSGGGSSSSSNASSSGGTGGAGSAGGATAATGSGGSSGSGSSNSAGSSGGSSSSSSSSSSPAVAIEDLGSLTATVSVSEVDTPKVALGQKTTLTFDAIDGLTLTGKVSAIDTAGTVSSGVVTYNITISLDTGDARIKPGMSVTAAITTAVKQDVLTVPNSAVKSQAGSQYVQVMVNGTPKQQPVTVGLSNDTDSEISSGLHAGDTIVTQTINPNASSSQSSGGLGGGARPGAFGGAGANVIMRGG